jgi:hypothetical protein
MHNFEIGLVHVELDSDAWPDVAITLRFENEEPFTYRRIGQAVNQDSTEAGHEERRRFLAVKTKADFADLCAWISKDTQP